MTLVWRLPIFLAVWSLAAAFLSDFEAGRRELQDVQIGEPGDGSNATNASEEVREEERVEALEQQLGPHMRTSSLALAVAVMVFGYPVTSVWLLYLVNHSDGDIRSYIWKMISQTFSLLCAVLIHQAMQTLLVWQIIGGKWPRGLDIEVTPGIILGVGFFLVIGSVTATHIATVWLRHTHCDGHAASMIGGHLTAFSGINAFGMLQQGAFFRSSWQASSSVLAIALALALLLGYVTQAVRKTLKGWIEEWDVDLNPEVLLACCGNGRTDSSQSSPDALEHTDSDIQRYRWEIQICDAENEALSLIMSYLILQVAIFCVHGNLLPIEGDDKQHEPNEILLLLGVSFAALVLLALFTWMRVLVERVFLLESETSLDVQPVVEAETSCKARMVNFMQSFMALTWSWLIERMGDWILRDLVDSYEFAQVVNATTMSTLSILLLFPLDCIADKIKGEAATDKIKHKEDSDEEDDSQLLGARVVRRASLVQFDPETHERTIRVFIGGLAFLVGNAWDKAFNAADETLVHATAWTQQHYVTSKALLALALTAFLIPAWIMYVVPKSLQTADDHKDIIKAETETEAVRNFWEFYRGRARGLCGTLCTRRETSESDESD